MTAGIGFCGLDRSRRPLHGDEIRGCWRGLPADPEAGAPARPAPAPAVGLRGFVPLDLIGGAEPGPPGPGGAPRVPGAEPPPSTLDATFDRATFFDLEA